MTDSAIHIENLSFRYPGSDAFVLRGIQLDIPRKDFVAIIGSNGSGKSTLCKAFNGLIPHFYHGDYEGQVIVMGASTLQHTVDVLSLHIGYVYQDFENQLVRPTVWDEITFAPINFGLKDYQERAERAMDILGLQPLREQFVWQLSGGQKHLVALAGVLALDPEIIVVDEPVAQLDPLHATLIYDKLRELNDRYGKTIIVIEHHTEFIAKYCKHTLLMDQGCVRWYKPVQEALNELDTLASLHILPPQVTQVTAQLYKQEGRLPTGLLPITVEEAGPLLQDFGRAAIAPLQHREQEAIRTAPILTVTDLHHEYKTIDKKLVMALTGINLEVRESERVAVVGNNGAGKSTLLKMITGIIKPTRGGIRLLDSDVLKLSPEQIADRTTYIYQNPEEMFIADSVREDVEYFLASREEADYSAFIDELIRIFRLQELQDRDGRLLSGGQQRRASLAIGMGMRPQLLLMDEPTASLDVSSRKEMTRMLELLDGRVKAVVVATHDMQLVAEWATRVIVMNRGRIVADLTPRELFSAEGLMRDCGLIAPQITGLSLRCHMQPPALSVEEFVGRYQMEDEHSEVC